MGFIAGPAIAGILATTIGPGATLAIDAASFGLSALGLFFVRRDLKAPTGRPHAPMTAEIREGIDYVLDNPTLRTAILFWGATSIVMAPLVTALAVHVTRDLGDEASILGLILSAFGVGTVGGSLVAGASDAAVVASRRSCVGGNLVMAVASRRHGGHRGDPDPGRRCVSWPGSPSRWSS